MIALILAAFGARRALAVTVALLAAFATAGAVTGPAYQAAVTPDVIAAQVAEASRTELVISIDATRRSGDSLRRFENEGPTLLAVPGFDAVLGVGYDVSVRSGSAAAFSSLTYRDDLCTQVRILAGRCAVGVGEVMVGQRTADRLGIGVGDAVDVTHVSRGSNAATVVDGPVRLTVIGRYEPVDTADRYWAGRTYFVAPTADDPGEPVFASRATLLLMPNAGERVSIDLVAASDAFTAERAELLRGRLTEVQRQATTAQAAMVTELPALLDRIDRNRATLGDLVPIAALPLVLLCWFVIYLAVAYAAEERRPELGLLALRGVPDAHRWVLGLGHSVVPVLAGAPVGYLVGQLVTGLVVTGTGTAWADGAPGVALLAVGGSLLAAVAAQRRLLSAPAVVLLRRVPPRDRRWAAATGESIVAVLAVAAVAQVRTSGGQLAGVALLAPALVALTVGLSVARLVRPVADLAGRRALRRGRIGPALAALHLGRRPGVQRLVALGTVALALPVFAAAAGDVTAVAGTRSVELAAGAPSVVRLHLVGPAGLLAATHAADPDGRWAMAAIRFGGQRPGDRPLLAVDSPRLAAVARWPVGSGLSVAAAARRLRPSTAPTYRLTGTSLSVEVTVETLDTSVFVPLRASLAPDGGGRYEDVELGRLQPGRHTYTAPVDHCADGCRLVELSMAQMAQSPLAVRAVVGRVDRYGAADLAAGGWHSPPQVSERDRIVTAPGADGLRVEIDASGTAPFDSRLVPGDQPDPLPVLASGAPPPPTVAGLDNAQTRLTDVGRVRYLPRLGVSGVLLDLEYAQRAMRSGVHMTDRAEVWLGPAAPPDAVARLRAAGLAPAVVEELDRALAGLRGYGAAVALRFHLVAGGLAVLLMVGALALVAGVDRPRRAEELLALRAQGLPRRVVATAARRGYLATALLAAVAGPVAAAIAWWAVGDLLPVGSGGPRTALPPAWPRPVAVVAPQMIGLAVLTAAALLVGLWLYRAVERVSGRKA